ncbi:hypothetical protein M885DRAFT_565111 [Pelagophyceae sp. CCMP2097]|nr:hypothetical protein M885DRAFT_565111 [Pelagophyceae sp. CCMP2097]
MVERRGAVAAAVKRLAAAFWPQALRDSALQSSANSSACGASPDADGLAGLVAAVAAAVEGVSRIVGDHGDEKAPAIRAYLAALVFSDSPRVFSALAERALLAPLHTLEAAYSEDTSGDDRASEPGAASLSLEASAAFWREVHALEWVDAFSEKMHEVFYGAVETHVRTMAPRDGIRPAPEWTLP